MPKLPKPAQGNGPAAPPSGQVQVRIAGQYVKDLSFENPNIGKLIAAQPENPNLDVEINVEIETLGANLYESAISFKARAEAKGSVIYDLEIVYGGAFQIENASPQALEAMLFVNCPVAAVPVSAPDRCRSHPRGRIPAAAARSRRLRVAVHAQEGAGNAPQVGPASTLVLTDHRSRRVDRI